MIYEVNHTRTYDRRGNRAFPSVPQRVLRTLWWSTPPSHQSDHCPPLSGTENQYRTERESKSTKFKEKAAVQTERESISIKLKEKVTVQNWKRKYQYKTERESNSTKLKEKVSVLKCEELQTERKSKLNK